MGTENNKHIINSDLIKIKRQCEKDNAIVYHELQYFKAIIAICLLLIIAIIGISILINEPENANKNTFSPIIALIVKILTDFTPFFLLTLIGAGVIIKINRHTTNKKIAGDDTNKKSS